MSSEEDKPPAPPVRLTSNRGGSDRLDGPPDLKPLPKGNFLPAKVKNWFFELITCSLFFTEPDDPDRKKKTLKSKIKSKQSHNDSKPNISYPTNFEHTVHVGFDAVTGEFTVSFDKVCQNISYTTGIFWSSWSIVAFVKFRWPLMQHLMICSQLAVFLWTI